ncbi:hypothetical protein CHUAL_004328 [Chamberlinius hualienensis]
MGCSWWWPQQQQPQPQLQQQQQQQQLWTPREENRNEFNHLPPTHNQQQQQQQQQQLQQQQTTKRRQRCHDYERSAGQHRRPYHRRFHTSYSLQFRQPTQQQLQEPIGPTIQLQFPTVSTDREMFSRSFL